jgi:ABC-type multidrug transport system fused ATPase/permease subunit
LNFYPTLSAPRREPEAAGTLASSLLSLLSGLLVPLMIVLVGLLAVILDRSGIGDDSVVLGTHLVLPLPVGFVRQTALAQLTEVVGVTLLVAAGYCVSLWLHRRSANARARRVVRSLHRGVFSQSLRRAELEGAAAQYLRADSLIGRELPLVQQGLALWYLVIPRGLVVLIGCVAVALLINVWLALLAVISGVLVWRLYQRLDQSEMSELYHWEVPRSRKRMAELVGRAPLLARLQTQGLADHAYAEELDSLYRRVEAEDHLEERQWPLLFLASAAAVAVLVLGLGVNLFDADSGLTLPSALVLGLSLSGAVSAASRLSTLASTLRRSSDAADQVYGFLRRSDAAVPSEQRVGFASLREGVELRNVTVGNAGGEQLLSHLSLEFSPGSFIALLGTEAVSTRALTELLMGFGQPSDGQVLLDGIALQDIHPQALARNVMWIDPTGPLWDGTIQENLRSGHEAINNSELVDALERVDVYERLQKLSDGLNTYVSVGDQTLGVETTYALGVARALLHRPSIVLAEEPLPPSEHLADDPCLQALQQLVAAGTLVIMLPKRLQTLRTADRVVLFNGPRLAGEGRHAELLESSDLYRHLNYLLFNPYRHYRQASPAR